MSQRATTPRKDARWANGPGDSLRQKSRWRWSRRFGAAALIGLTLTALALTGRERQQEQDRQRRPVAGHSAELIAGWVARTLNAVEFNNRCMAQMIVQVSVRDSLALATADAIQDQTILAQRLASWRQQAAMLPWTVSAMQAMADQVDSEIAWLNSLKTSFGSTALPRTNPAIMALPGTSDSHGLWQAMRFLQQQSLAALESLPRLAGDSSLSGSPAHMTAATASPDRSGLRWQTKSFDDFRPCIMQEPIVWLRPNSGQEYAAGGHPIIRRDQPSSSFQAMRPASPSSMDDAQYFRLSVLTPAWPTGERLTGRCPLGIPIDSGASATVAFADSLEMIADRTGDVRGENRSQGLASLILDRLSHQMADRLPLSRFSRHLPSQAAAKLRMLWPDSTGSLSLLPPAISPGWVTSLTESRRRIAQGQIASETLFMAIEVRSRWPLNDPKLGENGSWADAQPAHGSIRLIRLPGWVDPAGWPEGVLQVADGQWRDVWSYPVHQDPALGLSAGSTPAGQPIIHTIHRLDDFFFIAADFGQPHSLTNPYALADDRQLPGPVHWLGPDTLTVTCANATAQVGRGSPRSESGDVWFVGSLSDPPKTSATAMSSSSPGAASPCPPSP